EFGVGEAIVSADHTDLLTVKVHRAIQGANRSQGHVHDDAIVSAAGQESRSRYELYSPKDTGCDARLAICLPNRHTQESGFSIRAFRNPVAVWPAIAARMKSAIFLSPQKLPVTPSVPVRIYTRHPAMNAT